MSKRVLKILLKGSSLDREHVRLKDFIQQLNAFSNALLYTDLLVSGGEQPSTYYRITDLTHSSPATITLEAIATQPNKDYANIVVDTFLNGLRNITENNEVDEKFDRQTLEAYKGIAYPLKKNITEIRILDSGAPIIISKEFEAKIDKILGEDITCDGSLTGELDSVNVHNTNLFYIYPTVGPNKVSCKFPLSILEKVKIAIKRYVNVSGTLRYKGKDVFPYAIDVESLDIYSQEYELPTLWDIRGIAKNAIEGVDSVTFVRSLRDAKE